ETRPNWDTFCFYENAFTDEECDKIIQLGKEIKAQESLVGGKVDGEANHEIRKSRLSWLNWNQDTDWIFERIAKNAYDANSLRYRFNISGFLEPLQFTQYTQENDHYDWHQDSGPGNFSIRKLSAVLLLSDDKNYEGGNLEFFVLRN